ncbi:MAG: rane protein of unknown function [Gammaproteobacteria bacterium]|jgi:hypothetical protein|nr:rane protein of unknown function [Gammaproteobacteria bacterium]
MFSVNENENALEKLHDHFIKEVNGDPIPFDRREKLSLLLELIGASAGIYSWPPAQRYGQDKAPWVSYSLAITNPISNTMFLLKATDDFFEVLASESSVPMALNDIISTPSHQELARKYLIIMMGSAICAIPFGITTYLFPLPDCDTKACIAGIVAHSWVANTVLHAISWGLMLAPELWYYRIPYLPLEKAYAYYKMSGLSSQERKILDFQQQQELICKKYKGALVRFYTHAAENLVANYTKQPAGSVFAPRVALNESDASVMTLARMAGQLPEIKSRRCDNVVGMLGTAFIGLGCTGLIVSPIYLGTTWGLDLTSSTAVGLLPAYSTAVLCSFYGSAIFKQIYEYLSTWGGLMDKFSLEARLYPKTFALFLLFNIYVSAFAYGALEQLINTTLSDKTWDPIRPFLQDICIPAAIILSFIPLIGLFSGATRKVVSKFGPEGEHKSAVRLMVKTTSLCNRLQQMNNDKLIESIGAYSAEDQKILGIDPEQFSRDTATFHNLQENVRVLKGTALASSESGSHTRWPGSVWQRRGHKDEAEAMLLEKA